MCRVHALRIQHDINISAILVLAIMMSCAKINFLHVRSHSALECTDLIIQITREMASDLSSVVFKLLMLSSCMLVGGQNCSISGTLYLYRPTTINVAGLDYWDILYPTHNFHAIQCHPLAFPAWSPASQSCLAFGVGVTVETVAKKYAKFGAGIDPLSDWVQCLI